MQFDIPSQILAIALQRYAAAARRPAVFSSALVAGKRSNSVLGRHSPDEALRLLLNGTGLVAQKGKSGPEEAFVLKREASVDTAAVDVNGLDLDYGGWVQSQVWDALCADARTAPGDYRALLQFEVDAGGQIRQGRLLTSTGNAQRDTAVRSVLALVRVGRAPPPSMAQPLTMLLLPREAERAHDGEALCSQNEKASRS
ncbi:STN domain-containing protein [Variovorax sp. LT1R16]|uniref:STN domain-containing protein n=1 Tax=Variovorax sp. LT1R16 TaxID=3443728 RepID=UPI003F496019